MVWASTTKGHAMCWQCDHPEASPADYLSELRKTITKHKWAVQYVEDERRPFAYTIGLHKRGFAEYLVTGLSPEQAMKLLNSVAYYTIREVQPKPGDTMNIAGEVDLEFVAVNQPDAHLSTRSISTGRMCARYNLCGATSAGTPHGVPTSTRAAAGNPCSESGALGRRSGHVRLREQAVRMCWRCDHPNATVDDYLDELRKTMLESGWAVQYVERSRTPFAYTVGLHDCGLPELLITGVSAQRATRLLNTVAKDMMAGKDLTPGQKVAVTSGPLMEIVELANPDAHLT